MIKIEEIILFIVFLFYFISNQPLPANVAKLLNTVEGKIVLLIITISLFVLTNPIIGILGFLVAFDMLYKSSMNDRFQHDTQNKKINQQIRYNQEKSLEHQVIEKMAPIP